LTSSCSILPTGRASYSPPEHTHIHAHLLLCAVHQASVRPSLPLSECVCVSVCVLVCVRVCVCVCVCACVCLMHTAVQPTGPIYFCMSRVHVCALGCPCPCPRIHVCVCAMIHVFVWGGCVCKQAYTADAMLASPCAARDGQGNTYYCDLLPADVAGGVCRQLCVMHQWHPSHPPTHHLPSLNAFFYACLPAMSVCVCVTCVCV